MIEIQDKSKCCGCEACLNICPKQCITMKEDSEGFRYPHIDKEKCINCGLCSKICPNINVINNSGTLKELQYYAAYNKNDDVLKKSSSGGIFWLLTEEIYKRNGVVYGVKQDSTYEVNFMRAENNTECEALRGSKYLQAKVNDIYKQVKKDLDEDKYVLFSGTPCQIAALYKFLQKEYEKLYTVDVVCHGVPSDRVYREYISFMENKHKKKIVNIKWRDKVKGWGPNRITLYFEDGTTYTSISRANWFQTGFLENVYLRPSCYKCEYARLPRIGDISLADFWGYDGKLNKENSNKGLSAIIVTSKKGEELFNIIKENLIYHDVDKEYLTKRSRHVYIHPVENDSREAFFKDFGKLEFEKLAKKYKMKASLTDKIKSLLIKVKLKIKRMIKK